MNSIIYDKGFNAAKAGLSRSACPYSQEVNWDDYIDWITGFNDYWEGKIS